MQVHSLTLPDLPQLPMSVHRRHCIHSHSNFDAYDARGTSIPAFSFYLKFSVIDICIHGLISMSLSGSV